MPTGGIPFYFVLEVTVRIIIGLGNPGKEYERTRHNVGFDVIDIVSDRFGIPVRKSAMHGLIGEGFLNGQKVTLVKPQTFMNLSGQCVAEILSWYKPGKDEVLIVYDDIDLPLGKLRMRLSGSAGTHNGMRSVVTCTGRTDLMRLRVGVGHKPDGWDLADWVLSHYATEDERKTQFQAFLRAGEVIEAWVRNGSEEAMRLANASTDKPGKNGTEKE